MKESTSESKVTGRKKIIIVNPNPLFPIRGMYQIRVFNQIKCLSLFHDVDFLFLYPNNEARSKTIDEAAKYCREIIPVRTISQSVFFKIIRKTFLKKLFYILALPFDYFSLSNSISAKHIAKIIDKNSYDVVITHFWQSAGFFNHLSRNIPIKCIDTHYVVEEALAIYNNGNYSHLNENTVGKRLPKELKLQNKYFEISDLLIVNSLQQKDFILKSFPNKKVKVVPNGQSLDYFLDYPQKDINLNNKNILFYGALSNEFNGRALKRIISSILPQLKKIIPDIHLIILGASPPEWIKSANDQKNITVKGFVEDIRPVLAETYLALIPLESGTGFRGRTVELMAMGVPIIGTHNALDSINFTNGKHSFIIDDDKGIVEKVVTLINNPILREEISVNEKAFVAENYSLEATFGKLSDYFYTLEIQEKQ